MNNNRIPLACFVILLVLFAFTGCSKLLDDGVRYERVLQLDTSIDYNNDDYPAHLQFALEFEVSNPKAALGRVLFYDEILSLNERVSCSSCHKQKNAFSDTEATSKGFAMGETPRNALPIANMSMQETSLFWDVRASGLENLATMPIINHLEMGNSSLEDVIGRINGLDYYAPLFQAAFGVNEANETSIAQALSAFLRALRSYESAFDKATPDLNGGWNQNPPNFEDPNQRAGFELFGDLGCASCHFGNNIGGNSSANIGLDEVYTDEGKSTWTFEQADIGVFKIPSLRNVALTAPYMHDGRFKSLDEVLNHYSNQISSHPNLDWRLVDLSEFDFDLASLLNQGLDPIAYYNDNFGDELLEELLANQRLPVRLNLTEQDISNLKAFLETLTDQEFISDPRFSDPFVNMALN